MFKIFGFFKKKKEATPESFDVSDKDLDKALNDLKTEGSEDFTKHLEEIKKKQLNPKKEETVSEASPEKVSQQPSSELDKKTPVKEKETVDEASKFDEEFDFKAADPEGAFSEQELVEEPVKTDEGVTEESEPVGVEENKSSDEDNVTKVEDENASFEVPDFSDEDLDFDLGPEDVEDESSIPPTDELEEPETVHEGSDLPEFPENSDEPEHVIKDFNLPKFEIKKHDSKELPAFKHIFVEIHDYKKLLDYKDGLKSIMDSDDNYLEEINTAYKKEKEVQNKLSDEMESVKHSLLYIDRKLFGEGEDYEL